MQVWSLEKETNLFFFFSSMVFFLFLLLSVLFLIFCHLFLNFLLRLFYCNKLLLPPFVVLLFFFHHLLLSGWGTWMDGCGTDGWKGRPPLDRCLEANVTSPNYTYRVKPPNIQPKEEDRTDRHQGYYILILIRGLSQRYWHLHDYHAIVPQLFLLKFCNTINFGRFRTVVICLFLTNIRRWGRKESVCVKP